MGKSVHGGAVLAGSGLAASSVLVWPTPSLAQQVDPAALTECLISNTAQSHIDAMKRLMISALDDTGKLKSETAAFGNIIVQLAIDKCNITAPPLTDPTVGEAVARYGDKIGEKIMTDAFANLR